MPRTSSVSRTLPTSRTGRSSRNSKPDGVDIDTEENEEGGIDLELGVSVAGMGASISTSGVLKVGIGVAAVEFDLKEPNNSKLSYVWDLYEIQGKRDGCTVVLTYSIAGVEVKKETRTIPECEEEEPKPEPEPEPDPENPEPSKLPSGHPLDIVFRVLPGKGFDDGWTESKVLTVEETYPDNRPKIFKSKTTEARAFPVYYRPGSNPIFNFYAFPPISTSDPRWNFPFERLWTFKAPNQKGFIGTPVSYYQWFSNRNYREVGWNDERYVGFEGPRWWVDNETINYWTGIFSQIRYSSLNWQTIRTDLSYYPGQFHIYCEHIIEKHSSPLPRGIPPIRGKDKMNDCCKMTAALYEVFAVDEILSNGIKFPNRLIAAGAKDYSEVSNYLDFLSLIVREIDHLGIHPHEVTIKDVDPGTPGDQKISAEFINATAWAQSLMENSLKNDGEADARLNLQIRLARLLLQTFVSSVAAKYKADAIADFLGVPTQEFKSSPSVPFDITLGQRQVKGFGGQQSDKDKIKKLSTKKVVELLDRFLRESNQDVVCERFDEREQSFLELLQQLIQRG